MANLPYGVKVLDFFSVLATSADEKSFEFVSRNLSGVSLIHMQHLNQKQRTEPFIKIDQHEIVTRLGGKIARICHIRNEEVSRVSFTAGIDVTVNMKSYQVSFSHGVVVVCAYPNNYFPLTR